MPCNDLWCSRSSPHSSEKWHFIGTYHKLNDSTAKESISLEHPGNTISKICQPLFPLLLLQKKNRWIKLFHAKWAFSRFLNRLLIAQWLEIPLKKFHFTTLQKLLKILELTSPNFWTIFQSIFSRSLSFEIDLQKRPRPIETFWDGYFKKGLSLTVNHVPYTTTSSVGTYIAKWCEWVLVDNIERVLNVCTLTRTSEEKEEGGASLFAQNRPNEHCSLATTYYHRSKSICV